MAAAYTVHPIGARLDNYIWALCPIVGQHFYVVDPSDAAPVLAFAAQTKRTLKGILITHHHADHTGGMIDLQRTTHCSIYGTQWIEGCTHTIAADERLQLETDICFDILHTPGHTHDHIVYVDHDNVFCGDVLFNIGCGRLFEGSAEQGYASLQTLAQLPENLNLYAAHEYTLANLAFARTLEPEHPGLARYASWAQAQRDKKQPTLPTTLAEQKKLNPFLRCHEPALQRIIAAQTNTAITDPIHTFAQMRAYKDRF